MIEAKDVELPGLKRRTLVLDAWMEIEAALFCVDTKPVANIVRVGDRRAQPNDSQGRSDRGILLELLLVRCQLFLHRADSADHNFVGSSELAISNHVQVVKDVQAYLQKLLPRPPFSGQDLQLLC